MHEARAVSAAVEAALKDIPEQATKGDDLALRLLILDPTRASDDAVSVYARAILRERGLADATISVETASVACGLCGATTQPTVMHPVCDACGTPLRRQPGPAVVCEVGARAPASGGAR